jgi:hypothetical protein
VSIISREGHIEETVIKKLFNGVVPRWSDRVIVTGLRKVAWDDALVEELVDVYEELSKYIEGHSHTDEATVPRRTEGFRQDGPICGWAH